MPNYLIISTDNGQDMELHNNAAIVPLPNDEAAKSLIQSIEEHDNFFVVDRKALFAGDYRLVCEYNEVGGINNSGEYQNASTYNWSKLPEDKRPYAVAITCNINEFDILWDEEDYDRFINIHDEEESELICNFKEDGYDFIDDGENYIKIIKL